MPSHYTYHPKFAASDTVGRIVGARDALAVVPRRGSAKAQGLASALDALLGAAEVIARDLSNEVEHGLLWETHEERAYRLSETDQEALAEAVANSRQATGAFQPAGEPEPEGSSSDGAFGLPPEGEELFGVRMDDDPRDYVEEIRPRTLTAVFDVTGLTDRQIQNLAGEVEAQAERNKEPEPYDHPSVPVLKIEVANPLAQESAPN